MALISFSAGTKANASEVNSNFTALGDGVNNAVDQIYTGTAFNTTATSSSGTVSQTNEYEFSEITNIMTNCYVKIKILGTGEVSTTDSLNSAYCYVKIQSKYDGGAYADIMTDKYFNYISGSGGDKSTQSIEFLYAPTANEITNGLFIKVFSTSTAVRNTSGSATATFTNIQTSIEILPYV